MFDYQEVEAVVSGRELAGEGQEDSLQHARVRGGSSEHEIDPDPVAPVVPLASARRVRGGSSEHEIDPDPVAPVVPLASARRVRGGSSEHEIDPDPQLNAA